MKLFCHSVEGHGVFINWNDRLLILHQLIGPGVVCVCVWGGVGGGGGGGVGVGGGGGGGGGVGGVGGWGGDLTH